MTKLLINGEWREAQACGAFQAENPATKQLLPEVYPVSSWADCDEALEAASVAFEALQRQPRQGVARFLEAYAARIELRKEDLVTMAAEETGLPASPRLGEVELPRTTG
jgi:2,5-dioxopentanoate dehydrogenase